MDTNERRLAMVTLVLMIFAAFMTERVRAQGGTGGVPAGLRHSETNMRGVPSNNWLP